MKRSLILTKYENNYKRKKVRTSCELWFILDDAAKSPLSVWLKVANTQSTVTAVDQWNEALQLSSCHILMTTSNKVSSKKRHWLLVRLPHQTAIKRKGHTGDLQEKLVTYVTKDWEARCLAARAEWVANWAAIDKTISKKKNCLPDKKNEVEIDEKRKMRIDHKHLKPLDII